MKKIEPLRELNNIAQKPDYKKVGNWMARNITREMALPVTWLFLHLPITANGVTLIAFIFGASSAVFFAMGTRSGMLWGAALLQIWYLLDHVDGQVARYRKEESVTGVFFDYLSHHIIHIAIFIGIGWGVYLNTLNVFYILFAVIIGFSKMLLNLTYDSQYKAFYYWLNKRYQQKAAK
jgi:phosphatidylglycerophosphate synthase